MILLILITYTYNNSLGAGGALEDGSCAPRPRWALSDSPRVYELYQDPPQFRVTEVGVFDDGAYVVTG